MIYDLGKVPALFPFVPPCVFYFSFSFSLCITLFTMIPLDLLSYFVRCEFYSDIYKFSGTNRCNCKGIENRNKPLMYRNHSKRGSDKIPTKMLRASKKIYSFFVLDEEIIKKQAIARCCGFMTK